MDLPADRAQAAGEGGEARASQRGGAARSAALWISGIALALAAAQPIATAERALAPAWNPAPAREVASRCNLPSWHPRVACESGSGAPSLLLRLPPGHPPVGGRFALPPGHPPIGGMMALPPGHPPIGELDQGGSDLPSDHEREPDQARPRADEPWWI